jgi:branched-chain amino acid transport system substrate-binding protein
MKRTLFITGLAAVIAAGIYYRWTSTPSQETITIGCMAPFTGDGASYGRSTQEGVEFAVKQINSENRLPKPLKVIFEDDRIDAKVGATVIRKLIDIDRVPAILGPFGSSVVLACAPVANSSKTVLVTASATADGIAEAGDFVFRITPPNSQQGVSCADYSSTVLGCKKAAIIFQNNDYGTTLRTAFANRFKEAEGDIVLDEGVNAGTADFRPTLTKLTGSGADVLFFPVHHTEAATLVKQAREIGFSGKLISADGAMTPEFISLAGNAADGVCFSTLALDYGTAGADIEAFEESFQAAHDGRKPDVYTCYYFEATMLLASVIAETGAEGESIKEGLYAVSGERAYKGLTGITSFDSKGEVSKAFQIFVVRGKEYVRAKN